MDLLPPIAVALVGFMGSVIVTVLGGWYTSKIEPTKSRLKKAEMLFDLRVKAAREFNTIYEKYNPLNLGELYNGDIYGEKRWSKIREDISKYKAQNSYVFEGNVINKILDDILLSLDYSVNPTYMALDANGNDGEANAFEEDCYKDTLILMEKANEMIKKYLFEEANKA